MKSISNIITNALLIIIAITLVLIWRRMPPTVAEFNAAKGVDRTTLSMKQPVVRAVIPDTIDVNVENSSLDVDVSNAPIEVTIVR